MGSWKADQGLHQKDAAWTCRSRPPPSPEFQSVPKWEKRFCSQIPWSKFCEKKKMIHIFPKVLDWDDTAGKEAFGNAKARYWSEINGTPCDIPLPDPDMHIDVVDHEASVDPRLLQALYKEPPPPPPRETVDYDSVKIVPTGWDVEDPSPEISNIPTFITAESSWWDEGIDRGNETRATDEWIRIVPTGWGDEEEEDSHSSNAMDPAGRRLASVNQLVDDEGGWRQQGWDGRHRRREGGGRLGPMRSHGQGYETSFGWKDGNGRRKYGNGHHWYEKSSIERGLACAPVSHW